MAIDDNDNPKQQSMGWTKTSCTGTLLRSLEREGLIRARDDKAWRVPGSKSAPTPASDERVAFVDHIYRGLSFPLHPFFLAVLYAYGVQPHDLPPNSVQHIACFIILGECYLGAAASTSSSPPR